MDISTFVAWVQLALWAAALFAAAIRSIKKWREGNMQALSKAVYWLLLFGMAISAVSLYFNYRPRTVTVEKIVEKPVDRIVERLVPTPCPKVQTQGPARKAPVKKANNGGDLSASPQVQQPPQTQFCEGGNCAQSTGQTGGVTAGQINIGSPARHLSESDVQQLKSRLTPFHSKLTINAMAGTSDAVPLADELKIAIHDAGVSVDDEVHLVMPSGPSKPLYGVQLDFHGDALPLNAPVWYLSGSQLGILAGALEAAHMHVASVHPNPNLPEDSLTLTVGLNPADKR